jgi:hypothetical protein
MKDVIHAGFFADAINPTDDEILRWAFIEGAHYPPEMSQDWDLCVAEPARRELLVGLASDPACPNRKFFLSCLYLMVGDCIRSSGRTWSREEAGAWLGVARPHAPADVQRFFERAKDLVAGRTTLVYEQWCDGGYAYRDQKV